MANAMSVEKYLKDIEKAIEEGEELNWKEHMTTLIGFVRKLKNQARISQRENGVVIDKYQKAIRNTCKHYGIEETEWYEKYFN